MNAKRVIADIVEKAGTLSGVPRMGKMVPEVQDDLLREIHVHSWRILYHLRNQHIYIITLVHKRRQLKEQDVPAI